MPDDLVPKLPIHMHAILIYVTLFWKTDHVITFSISRNTDFKY